MKGVVAMESYYWLILMAILLIIEIITLGLTTIWFAFGSLAAYIAAVLGGGSAVQIVVFCIVSLVTLIFTRPFAVKFFNRDRIQTNADSLIGQNAKVIEVIDNINATGRVMINGQEWSARSHNDEVIGTDATVVVGQISGVKLIVSLSDKIE